MNWVFVSKLIFLIPKILQPDETFDFSNLFDLTDFGLLRYWDKKTRVGGKN